MLESSRTSRRDPVVPSVVVLGSLLGGSGFTQLFSLEKR